MRIAVFGASGGVGSEFVRLAVAQGHSVIAAYRQQPVQPVAGVDSIVGPDILEESYISRVIVGADVVVSAIGLRRRHPANPWSRIVSPPDLTSRFAAALIAAMTKAGRPQRVLAISAAGVGDSRAKMNPLVRGLFDVSNVGVAYRDLEAMEAAYAASTLDWLCVRPVTLTYGKGGASVRVVPYYGLLATVARVDVAAYLLARLADPGSYNERTPMIAS